MSLDKERYGKELKDLTCSNQIVNKPKKPLTPYMLFVREVIYNILKFKFMWLNFVGLQIDKTKGGER